MILKYFGHRILINTATLQKGLIIWPMLQMKHGQISVNIIILIFQPIHVQNNIIQNYITHFMANTKLSCEQVLHFTGQLYVMCKWL